MRMLKKDGDGVTEMPKQQLSVQDHMQVYGFKWVFLAKTSYSCYCGDHNQLFAWDDGGGFQPFLSQQNQVLSRRFFGHFCGEQNQVFASLIFHPGD